MGFTSIRRIVLLGIPALFTAQTGVYLANISSAKVLQITWVRLF
ncbi:hypothetical protein RintRC_7669 [Richelia intracellularis]|nr:hypothetical protein RintRC_7669 [Richelia intracellularis]